MINFESDETLTESNCFVQRTPSASSDREKKVLQGDSKDPSENMKDFEEVTAFLGHWGRFQKVVFFLLLASTIPNGLGIVSIVFMTAIPKHQCKIPEVNLTQDWLSVITPVKVN